MILLAVVAGSIITVHVDTAPAHKVNTIRPLSAIGVGVDSDPAGKIPLLYSPARTRLMLGAGLGTVSLRLYTELSIQDWHWNPAGQFSDAKRKQGYWISSAALSNRPIVDSFGYMLPHRGSTEDQGDNNNYSRIDDGDPTTYWKSDPYLTSAYTGDRGDTHSQWAVIDLIHPKSLDAIQIDWVNPYAIKYEVQYWTGGDAIVDQASGTWHTFPRGVVRDGKGGNALIRLSPTPVKVRFVRVLMSQSSNTCDTHGRSDRRNCVGYAIQEIALGQIDSHGGLHDIIVHSTCGGNPFEFGERSCKRHQTVIFVSSIDPWHRSVDQIQTGQDQPGLDFVSRNAITRGLPTMYAVPMLYSTPENAAAEVTYLRARGYPISYIEMGEEVDGQYAMPEDYAALYVQFAKAIHAKNPSLRLGGPIFMGVNSDVKVWRDAHGDNSWLRRFLKYLKSHGRLSDLAFMSFEHYPFRGCDQGVVLRMDLLREPSLVRGIIETWRADGLPKNIPMFITEVNFASNGGPVPKQIAGALWMADWIGAALSSGLAGLNHYQYEAEPLGRNRQCGKWGGYGMFITDRHFRILAKSAQYYSAQMLTQQWLSPGNKKHELYPATTDQLSKHPSVTAYAAKRPDGLWSIMLVNKDMEAHSIHINFRHADGARDSFDGPVQVVTFGSEQYNWRGDTATEIPAPNEPPTTSEAPGAPDASYVLPRESITVVRGKLPRAQISTVE